LEEKERRGGEVLKFNAFHIAFFHDGREKKEGRGRGQQGRKKKEGKCPCVLNRNAFGAFRGESKKKRGEAHWKKGRGEEKKKGGGLFPTAPVPSIGVPRPRKKREEEEKKKKNPREKKKEGKKKEKREAGRTAARISEPFRGVSNHGGGGKSPSKKKKGQGWAHNPFFILRLRTTSRGKGERKKKKAGGEGKETPVNPAPLRLLGGKKKKKKKDRPKRKKRRREGKSPAMFVFPRWPPAGRKRGEGEKGKGGILLGSEKRGKRETRDRLLSFPTSPS